MERLQNSLGMVLAGGSLGVLLALANCFFGYRLQKLWIALGCFAVGATLGGGLGTLFFKENPMAWAAAALVLGLVLAVLSFRLYLSGVFLLCFALGCIITLPFAKFYGGWGVLVCVAAGVVLGILGTKFVRPVLIVATALGGGVSAARALGQMLASVWPNLAGAQAVPLVAGLVLAVVGIMYQFKHTKSGV